MAKVDVIELPPDLAETLGEPPMTPQWKIDAPSISASTSPPPPPTTAPP